MCILNSGMNDQHLNIVQETIHLVIALIASSPPTGYIDNWIQEYFITVPSVTDFDHCTAYLNLAWNVLKKAPNVFCSAQESFGQPVHDYPDNLFNWVSNISIIFIFVAVLYIHTCYDFASCTGSCILQLPFLYLCLFSSQRIIRRWARDVVVHLLEIGLDKCIYNSDYDGVALQNMHTFILKLIIPLLARFSSDAAVLLKTIIRCYPESRTSAFEVAIPMVFTTLTIDSRNVTSSKQQSGSFDISDALELLLCLTQYAFDDLKVK